MATTTRAVLRQRIGVVQWPWAQIFTTTSAGNSSPNNTVISTGIEEIPDSLVEMYLLILDGTSAGEMQRVKSVSGATMTMRANYDNQIVSGVTFELHKVYPTMIHNALDRAGADLQRWLNVPIRDESLIVDNILDNHAFVTLDSGANTFEDWQSAGSPTVTADTSRKIYGSQSARVVADGGADGILEQRILSGSVTPLYRLSELPELLGKTLRFQGWVLARAKDTARLRVTFDNSIFFDGPWHKGGDEWEGPATMHVEATIPSDVTSAWARVMCQVLDGNTGNFGLTSCTIIPIQRYTVPTSIITGPYRILIQDRLGEPNGHYRGLQEGERPGAGRILRLIGKGKLATLSSDTSTVEIGEPQTQLLLAQALFIIYRDLSQATTVESNLAGVYGRNADYWERRVEALKRTPGIGSVGMAAEHPRAWNVEEDASGRYIEFKW